MQYYVGALGITIKQELRYHFFNMSVRASVIYFDAYRGQVKSVKYTVPYVRYLRGQDGDGQVKCHTHASYNNDE